MKKLKAKSFIIDG